MLGKIRVGRCEYSYGKRTDPSFQGFTKCITLTPSTEYGSLSPYMLKDDNGHILENIWQFSGLYEKVPPSTQKYSKWNQTVIWEHPEETHAVNMGQNPETGKTIWSIQAEYFAWRQKGFSCAYAIRYPVGYEHRSERIFALKTDVNGYIVNQPLNYINSRKEIYLPIYDTLVRRENDFIQLKTRLMNGENLLIVEVDGPHQESMDYYRENYEVDDDFIVDGTMLATEENIQLMLDDPRHPFGHGYCLASALLDLTLT